MRKVPLHLDGGRQRAPPYGYLGDLAVRVEQGVVHSVDHGVLPAPPCTQSMKDSKAARCWANVVTGCSSLRVLAGIPSHAGASHSDHRGAAVGNQLHPIDVA